jgi:hypothetical protein
MLRRDIQPTPSGSNSKTNIKSVQVLAEHSFDPEDGDGISLRNSGLLLKYASLQPRRLYSLTEITVYV